MKNINFKSICIGREVGKNIYRIENYDGMTNDEIFDACNGDSYHFGGVRFGNIVTIYID